MDAFTLSPWVSSCPSWCHTVPMAAKLSPEMPHRCHTVPQVPSSPDVAADLSRALPLLLGDVWHSQAQPLLLCEQIQPHSHTTPRKSLWDCDGHKGLGGFMIR